MPIVRNDQQGLLRPIFGPEGEKRPVYFTEEEAQFWIVYLKDMLDDDDGSIEVYSRCFKTFLNSLLSMTEPC